MASEKKSKGEPVNRICPVYGQELVGIPDPVTIEYEGRIEAYCTDHCVRRFRPEVMT